jgi:hypothetical protein
MITATAFATCILAAANTYQVPAAAMIGIMQVEGGHVGQQVPNYNGSYDLGPMQVNTLWMPQLARNWKVSVSTARAWVRDDPCTNVYVAAWILKQKIVESGSLYYGIAHYHSATPRSSRRWSEKVLSATTRPCLMVVPNISRSVKLPKNRGLL